MEKFRALVVLASLLAAGCGVQVTPTADPISLSGELKMDGSPVTGVKLNLQPTGEGLPAVLDVTEGEFSGEVIPGKYTYFLTQGKSASDFKKIPEDYQAGSMDREFEIKDGTALELEIQ